MKSILKFLELAILILAFFCFIAVIISSIFLPSKGDLTSINGTVAATKIVKSYSRYFPPAKSLQIGLVEIDKPIRTAENSEKFDLIVPQIKPGTKVILHVYGGQFLKLKNHLEVYEISTDKETLISYEQTIKNKKLSKPLLLFIAILAIMALIAVFKKLKELNNLTKG